MSGGSNSWRCSSSRTTRRRFFSNCRASELGTDAKQRHLIALSTLGDGPYRTADAARATEYQNVGGASGVRDELIEKELIWSRAEGGSTSRSHASPTTCATHASDD